MKVGDKVRVNDDGLKMLREIMAQFGEEVPPNNEGVIAEIIGDEAIILFDDTKQEAPYLIKDCEKI